MPIGVYQQRWVQSVELASAEPRVATEHLRGHHRRGIDHWRASIALSCLMQRPPMLKRMRYANCFNEFAVLLCHQTLLVFLRNRTCNQKWPIRVRSMLNKHCRVVFHGTISKCWEYGTVSQIVSVRFCAFSGLLLFLLERGEGYLSFTQQNLRKQWIRGYDHENA